MARITPPPHTTSREPELLAGRFEIVRRLGEGAFGVVHEVEDRRDGGRVALKILRQPEADWLYAFKQEFRTIQGLSHPNLVALHELFCDEGRWFFTMELIDGVDLLSFVRGREPRDEVDEAVRIHYSDTIARAPASARPLEPRDDARLRHGLRQLLEGLAVLHAAGKVHRDIKPSNVLVTRDGRVVLLDFGLTTEAFGSAGSSVVGTPAYMAPEQAASRVIGPPADIYAIGVLLYKCLTGRLPVEGSPLQMLIAKQTDRPPAPLELDPTVASDLNALCVEMLKIQPADRPTAADAFRVMAEPGTTPPDAFHAGAEPPLFVGRTEELATLRGALEASGCGELAAVLLCGESGIGKSLTVRRFLAREISSRRDVLVLEGRCHEREAVPYKAIDGVVDALSRRLSRLESSEVAAVLPARAGLLAQIFPVLLRVPQIARDARLPKGLPPQELRQRAFTALRELFTRLALHRQTVIVIDDLQWADVDGLAALCEILRPPDPPPLLFIGTLRTPSADGARVRERISGALQSGLHVIELGALQPSEARELAATLLGRAGAESVAAERIAAEAAGHPMFVEELTRHVALGVAEPGEAKLDDAIWSRLHQLEPFTREVAELAAIAGKPLRLQLAASALGLARARFDAATTALRASSLVKTSGTGELDAIEPYHDRVREAVLARIDPERKRLLHEALARTFEVSTEQDYEALASHWFEAGDRARSATSASAAGDEASRAFAFDRAARCYEQALERSPDAEGARHSLRLKLANALALAGRGALAAPHFEVAAKECPPDEALELRRRAAEQLLRAGLIDRGLVAAREVLRAIGMRLPRSRFTALVALAFYSLRFRIRGLHFEPRSASAAELTRIDTCWSIGWNLAFVESVIGYLFSLRSLLLALAAGDRERVICSLGIVTAASAIGGGRSWRKTEMFLRHTNELGARTREFRSRVFAKAASGGAYHLNGRFREAVEQLTALHEMLNDDTSGLTHERVMCRMFLSQALSFAGRFKALRQIQREGLLDAFSRGDVYATVNLRIGASNLVWLIEDRPDIAEQQAIEAIEQWSKHGFHNEHAYALVARIHARSYVGDFAVAHAIATEFMERARRSLVWRIQVLRVRALYARGTVACALLASAAPADRKSLLRTADRDARALERENMTWIRPFAAVVRAGIAFNSGERESALKMLEQAALDFAAGDMLAYAAAARARAATLRDDADERARAEADLRAEEVIDPQRMIRLLTPGFD